MLFGCAIVLAILLVLVFYRHRRLKEVAALAAHFQGRVSLLGDTVGFAYRGAAWEVQRLASQGGQAGTGGYDCLVLALEAGPGLVLGPAAAMKYVYALSLPREHSNLRTPSAPFVAVGPAHRRVAAALSDADAAALLERLFVQPYAVLQVRRETHLDWGSLLRRRWVLRLTGLPQNLYTQPELLQPFLDNVILLCGRIDVCIDRRFGVA